MKKKFQKKLLKAMKNNDCDKINRICDRAGCGRETLEELLLRALFGYKTADDCKSCD